ncbi:major facilitator superfamily domain-containing protein [Ditylenchus destructor]|nr:major facilitator superfamily domain-containing protein [Ditylenchus destructor]
MAVKTAPEIYIVENASRSTNKNSFKSFVSNLQRRSENKWTIFGNYSRFAILTLSMLCMTIMGSNSVLLNFTIICMTHSSNIQTMTTTPGTVTKFDNATLQASFEEDDYNARERGWMFSAVAIGGIIGILPTPFLITHFGLRTIYTICGLFSAIFTFTMPFTEKTFGFTAIFIMRFVQVSNSF